LKAALKLTGTQAAEYAKDLDIIADKTKRAGATQKAFEEQTKTLAFKWEKLKTTFEVLFIKIGAKLAPFAKKIVDKLQTAFNFINENLGAIWITIKFSAKRGWVILSSFFENIRRAIKGLQVNMAIFFKWVQVSVKGIMEYWQKNGIAIIKSFSKILVTHISDVLGVLAKRVQAFWQFLLTPSKKTFKIFDASLATIDDDIAVLTKKLHGSLVKVAFPKLPPLEFKKTPFVNIGEALRKVGQEEMGAWIEYGLGKLKSKFAGLTGFFGGKKKEGVSTITKAAPTKAVSTQMAGAIEQGSLEAYRATLGGKDPNAQTAENTKKTADISDKQLKAQKKTNILIQRFGSAPLGALPIGG